MGGEPTIFHITTKDAWRSAVSIGTYRGTPQDQSDGFIHFSTASALPETAQRYFAGRNDLIVLEVCLGTIGDDVRWEALPGRPAFPHLYADLDPRSVEAVHPLPLADDGSHVMDFL